MLSDIPSSSSKEFDRIYTSFSQAYRWNEQNEKKPSEIDVSDAASTSEGSVSPAELFETESDGSSVCNPVIVPLENLGLWYIVESCQNSAHFDSDIPLVYCFANFTSCGYVSSNSVRLLLGAIWVMHLCHYDVQDICSVLAHASVYFSDVYAICGTNMSQIEKSHVMASLIYLAHTYVLDDTCPLRFWHKHLFRSYCEIATLDKAVMQMMAFRNYILRVDDEILSKRFASLQQSVEGGVKLMV